MRTRRTIGALVAAAALAAPAATAANEPAAYGTATRSTLNVVSGVLVAAKSVDLRGVWLDETKPCTQTRTLRVSIEVFYSSSSGATKRTKLAKSGAVGNCAEGGPNFGYTFKAAARGYACASGAWKPGNYSFVTKTRDTTSGLVASASLSWTKRGSC